MSYPVHCKHKAHSYHGGRTSALQSLTLLSAMASAAEIRKKHPPFPRVQLASNTTPQNMFALNRPLHMQGGIGRAGNTFFRIDTHAQVSTANRGHAHARCGLGWAIQLSSSLCCTFVHVSVRYYEIALPSPLPQPSTYACPATDVLRDAQTPPPFAYVPVPARWGAEHCALAGDGEASTRPRSA